MFLRVTFRGAARACAGSLGAWAYETDSRVLRIRLHVGSTPLETAVGLETSEVPKKEAGHHSISPGPLGAHAHLRIKFSTISRAASELVVNIKPEGNS